MKEILILFNILINIDKNGLYLYKCSKMETLILNSDSKADLELLKEIALKFGVSVAYQEKAKDDKYERLRKLAKKMEANMIPSDISMDEIVEELRLVREDRQKYGDKNNS